jgi:Ca2+-binding RTX toxin-like protein
MYGNNGNNTLNGGAGRDRIDGAHGNDSLFGGDGDDFVADAHGNDTLDGGAGKDDLHGGVGNDTYLVDGLDTVVELAGEGFDKVTASQSFALGALAEVEVLLAQTGTAAINLTGSDTANTITGNNGANRLYGQGGNDVVSGGAGRDRLFGGVGNDTLKGDAGNDTIGGGDGNDKLYGGKGKASKDVFVFDFNPVTKAAAKLAKDTIYDFGHAHDAIGFDDAAFTNKTIAKFVKSKKGATLDKMVKMDPKFVAFGKKAMDKNDFFIVDKGKGKIYFDVDGSGRKGQIEIASFKNEKNAGIIDASDFFFV